MSLSGIWTSKGIDKLAAQTAGGPTLTIDKIALGDGGGIVPAVLPSQAALLKEVWRGLVNAVLIEPDTPNTVTVEAVIPYSVGGFYIREWGIFDTDGDLIAVGPHAEFYKPLLAEGSGAELLERIQLPLANAGQVNLTISSEALATRKYVDQTATAKAKEEVTRHDGDVTAHGGRIATLLKRKISTTAPLTGGGDLSGDRTLTINASSMATVNYVIQRDGAGRAQVAAPAAAADIARKAEVDAVESRIPASWPLMIVTWDAAANYKRKTLVIGSNGKIYMWLRDSGPGVAGVGGKDPTAAANATYWLDYAASITPPPVSPYTIGVPMSWRSTTLGANMVWANRDAIYFAHWPEFKAIYDVGGFAGMLLPASATQAEQNANLGKWVLLPNGTGLLTPNWGGQFMRNYCPGFGTAGAWSRDEIRNITGSIGLVHSELINPSGSLNIAGKKNISTGVTPYISNAIIGFSAAGSVQTGVKNKPESIDQPLGIYMGTHA